MNLWPQALDQITKEYQSAFGHLNVAQLNWKPNPDRWSIAQIIDHVMVTNSTYFPIITEIKAGTYKPHFIAKFGFLVSFFGKLILGAVQPESRRKNKTFPPFEPARSGLPADLLSKFATHQARLTREISSSQNLLDRVVSSPANRMLVYRLDRAFDIIVAHERRHLLQAKEVLAQLPGSI